MQKLGKLCSVPSQSRGILAHGDDKQDAIEDYMNKAHFNYSSYRGIAG